MSRRECVQLALTMLQEAKALLGASGVSLQAYGCPTETIAALMAEGADVRTMGMGTQAASLDDKRGIARGVSIDAFGPAREAAS